MILEKITMLRMYIYNVYSYLREAIWVRCRSSPATPAADLMTRRIGSFHMFSQYSCIECENDMEIIWNDYIYMKSIFSSILGFLYLYDNLENPLVI